MAIKTYRGSCHCGKVTFEADIDLAEGTGRCNCSFCWKTRKWGIGLKPDALRLLTGKDDLSDYSSGPHSHNLFCKHCGVRPYSYGTVAEIGGDYVSVYLTALDDVDPLELIEAPLRYMDGKANNWWHPPAETRHL